MIPGLPPLNLQLASTKSSESGGISAPNTFTAGSFGGPTVGGFGAMLPYLALGAAVLFLRRRN